MFNIRVYGLMVAPIDGINSILVSDECRNGFSFTKFPGGGLEFGEGIADALIREFIEELNVDITIGDLYYVNPHFQISAFNEKEQIISFYYFVSIQSEQIFKANHTKPHPIPNGESPRWIALSDLKASDFTFPIDKMVAEKLANTFNQ